MTRHFGLTHRAGGPNLAGGTSQHPARLPVAPYETRRNPEIPAHLVRYYDERNSLPPLPAQSLRDEPVILDSDREIGATVFVIGFHAFIVASLYAIIKLFE